MNIFDHKSVPNIPVDDAVKTAAYLDSAEWAAAQDPTAVRAVLREDAIFKVAQEGIKDLEAAWVARSKNWKSVLDRSVKTGIFGLGSDIVDSRWLFHVLFRPSRFWPSGLTENEKILLKLAVAVAKYHPLFAQGYITDRSVGITPLDPVGDEPPENTLKAMKKFAAYFEKKIADPMFQDYRKISILMGRKILPLCEKMYEGGCSPVEATDIFRADLERGWKLQTLDASTATYRTFPYFTDYANSVL